VRAPAALLALATAVALTACSPDATEPAPAGSDDAVLATVVVTGDLGSEPTVEFDRPFTIDAPVARADVAGDGAPLELGQRLKVDYMMVDGDTGETLASTWATDTPESITLGDPQIVAALNTLLAQQNLGARVVVAVPGGEATETTEAYPAIVMAMEVLAIAPMRAQGDDVEPAEGLPVVTLDDAGAPSIEIPADAAEPTELVVQPLIVGDGPEVEAGSTVVVQYSGWLWDGTSFDSSWENGAPMTTPIGVGRLIPGWDQGLVGQTIGSQVLLVVPPELGYGDAGSGSIPPGATLIFVVDLLETF
jgi:peptidylprolyl isomerase